MCKVFYYIGIRELNVEFLVWIKNDVDFYDVTSRNLCHSQIGHTWLGRPSQKPESVAVTKLSNNVLNCEEI